MAINLSRQQLYERVWSAPVSKIAPEFELSDVGLAKACRKLKIPVPPLGYWAKLKAGKNPPKTPLPNIEGANSIGPEEIAEQQKQKRIELPAGTSGLHPMVRKFGTALRAAKPNYQKHHEVGSFIDGISVTEPRINRALRALHVIVVRLESRGIEFRPSTWTMKYARPTFKKDRNKVLLGIEELHETVKTSTPYLHYGENKRPSGRFEFTITTGYGYNNRAEFVEQKDSPLEELLHKVAERIWNYFMECEERARKAEEEHKRWVEEERIRRETQRKEDHAKALTRITATRRTNLWRAAKRWHIHQEALEFIAKCEKRWMSQSEGLSADQLAWLEWARQEVKEMSPFEKGYPQPINDGAFDPSTVPFGGPYPTSTSLS